MSNKLSLVVNFASTGLNQMSAGLRTMVGLGRNGSQALRALNGDARRLQREMRDVSRELSRGSGNVTELVNRERALERALADVNRQLQRQQRLRAIDADRAAMRAHAGELKAKGTDNVMSGVALAAPLILATKSAAEFSSGLVDIQQKADLSDRATDALASRIIMLADRAKQMPEDMRAGLDILLSAGMNLDPATQMLEPIGKLATAYKVEIPDAANAGYAAMMNLKIPANQVRVAFAIMAQAGKDGRFEIADMARQFPTLTAQMQALGEVGPRAAADLSAALQVAMHTAGNADEAGNNIQNLLTKINAPATISAFKKNFGIDLPAALAKLEKQGYSSMEAIALLTTKATKGDTKKLGFAFEDQQARMGLLAIIQNMDEYREIRTSAMAAAAGAAKAGGLVDRQFDQRAARDATVKWRAFLGTASSLAIVLGSTLLPVMTQSLAYMHDVAAAVMVWAQQNPALAGTLMKVAAGLITARIGIGALQIAFGGFLGPAANVIAFFRKVEGVSKFTQLLGLLRGGMGATATVMVRAFGVMRIAAMFLARGVMQAGMIMLANPIVLAITAIVLAVAGAGYLIYRNWGTIKAAFVTGVSWVKGVLAAVPSWLSNIGSMMMQGLLMALNPMILAQRLLSIAKSGITAFKNFFGIKSPSRLFMEMGGHLTTGLARGIDRGGGAPKRALSSLMTGIALAAAPPALAAGAGPVSETPPAGPRLAVVRKAQVGGPAVPEPVAAHQLAAPAVNASAARLGREGEQSRPAVVVSPPAIGAHLEALLSARLRPASSPLTRALVAGPATATDTPALTSLLGPGLRAMLASRERSNVSDVGAPTQQIADRGLATRLQAAPAIQPAARAPRQIAAAPGPITVHVHGAPGQDVRALAREVMREIKRASGVDARSSYEGDR